MSTGNDPRYHAIPRDSLESDRQSAEYLLPSPATVNTAHGINVGSDGRSFKILNVNPSIVMRLISSILALISFTILVISGGNKLIAADFFLMLTIVLNSLALLRAAISHAHLLSITIKVKDKELKLGGSSNRGTFTRPNFHSYLDLFFAIPLLISLAAGWADTDWDYRYGAQEGAVILGYIVVAFQTFLALPHFERLSFTLQVHVKPLQSRHVRTGDYFAHGADRKKSAVSEAPHTESSAIPEPVQQAQESGTLV